MHRREPLEVSDKGNLYLPNLLIRTLFPGSFVKPLDVLLFIKKFVYNSICLWEYIETHKLDFVFFQILNPDQVFLECFNDLPMIKSKTHLNKESPAIVALVIRVIYAE